MSALDEQPPPDVGSQPEVGEVNMDVHLLGPVEVVSDETPIALGGPKQRALLAMLALEAGTTVSMERLIDGLWGDDPPATAAKLVQLYVSHLRKAMAGCADEGGDRHARRRVRAACRAPSGGCRAVRAAAGAGCRARGAESLARPAVGRRGQGAVRRARDQALGRAAHRRARGRDRPGPRGRAPPRGAAGARVAACTGAAARAPARAAHARSVPLRPPGGRARGLPAGAGRAGRADRRGAGPRPAPAARRDPAAGPVAGRARRRDRTARAVDAAAGPRRRARAAALVVVAGARGGRRRRARDGRTRHGQDPAGARARARGPARAGSGRLVRRGGRPGRHTSRRGRCAPGGTADPAGHGRPRSRVPGPSRMRFASWPGARGELRSWC